MMRTAIYDNFDVRPGYGVPVDINTVSSLKSYGVGGSSSPAYLHKIYNDGSHYVGTLVQSLPKKKKKLQTVKPELSEGVTSDEPVSFREAVYEPFMREKYNEYNLICRKRKNLIKNVVGAVIERFKDDAEAKSYFGYLNTDGYEYDVKEYCERRYKNEVARKKRFRRKAYNNPWNYFVTFTYDDEKQTEESFREGIRKCLSNLHSRRGWNYMCVFERGSKTDRLHLHALMYIPAGEMIGNIEHKKKYSFKAHKYREIDENDFFFERFGQNDFEAIDAADLRRGDVLGYLLKYITKTDERIIYSRGVPCERYAYVKEDAIVLRVYDFVDKFVYSDDVFFEWDVIEGDMTLEDYFGVENVNVS